jgi:hypothetical protein
MSRAERVLSFVVCVVFFGGAVFAILYLAGSVIAAIRGA